MLAGLIVFASLWNTSILVQKVSKEERKKVELWAEAIQKKIAQNERERRDLAGIKKLANERQKKANLHFSLTLQLLVNSDIKN